MGSLDPVCQFYELLQQWVVGRAGKAKRPIYYTHDFDAAKQLRAHLRKLSSRLQLWSEEFALFLREVLFHSYHHHHTLFVWVIRLATAKKKFS